MREPPIEMLRARLRTRGRGTYSFCPWTPIYSFCPWEAYGANKRKLPLKIDEGRRGAEIRAGISRY